MTVTADDSLDGRVLRGQRNREAIVDSLIELYSQGNVRPTAAAVAEQARLSTRSVYHHFDDMNSLVLEVAARSDARWQAITAPPEPLGPVEDRVRGFAEHRFTRWSITAPVVRAGLVAMSDSSTVTGIMRSGSRGDLQQIRDAFAPELREATQAKVMLAGLGVAFDFLTWERLHVVSGLSHDNTVAAMSNIAFGFLL
jgi:TetR/AcrR family transcriptional regulator of autoinduction and epiphytic fitness